MCVYLPEHTPIESGYTMSQSSLFIDMALTVTAVLLAFFSLNTLKALARSRVRTTMWVPVLVSSVFFLYGSLAKFVFHFLFIQSPQLLMINETIDILHGISWLIGLVILTYGIFMYSQVTKNVTK